MRAGPRTSSNEQFANGRRFRILNIVDDVTKQCLGAIPDTSISGRRVARELTALIKRHGKPGMIVSDHGTNTPATPCWPGAATNDVDWHFHCPRKADAKRLRRKLQRAHARRLLL